MDHVGEQYAGVVSAVTGFGLFVMLDDLYVEGLIHVTGLPKDYYYHEAAQHRMVGERTGRVFRLGQKLQVKVVRVNLEERKIDFELVDKSAGNADHKRTKPSLSKRVKVSAKAAELASEYEKKRKRRAKAGTKESQGQVHIQRWKGWPKRKSSAKAKMTLSQALIASHRSISGAWVVGG